jgi:diguanylate cyclase (GGDEF)-like protein
METFKRIGRFHFFTLYIIVAIVAFGTIDRYWSKVSDYKSSHFGELKTQFKAVLQSYNQVAEHVLRSEVNTLQVQSIMASAAKASSEAELKEYHEMLLWYLQPLYENLKLSDIRQFHFHLPGAISFARFHKPEKYGDSLADVRYSIVQVNKTHQPVRGFEEGRVFNGFRHVFPIFHEGVFVGTVEISYSFDAIRKAARKILAAQYHFMLSAEIIGQKVWDSEQSNYVKSDISDKFLYDKATLAQLVDVNDRIDEATIRELNARLPDTVKNELESFHAVQWDILHNSEDYLVTFLPVKNVEGDFVAYFIVYETSPRFKQMRDEFIFQIGGVAATTLLATLFMVFYRRHYEKALQVKAIEKVANTDSLTRIGNRTFFVNLLPELMNDAWKNDTAMSIIFFDIDHFKRVNDTYGHQAGDEVMVELVELAKSVIRAHDVLIRWGGEEFIVILNDTGLEHAGEVAEKIRGVIETHDFDTVGKVTCSFGVTDLQQGDDPDTLIERADAQLYCAKEAGRNCVRTHRA